ncbi:Uncharacterized protein DBV15_00796 [Temnothorax longispinosus]|uniref:Uncharacterized protein n=1 Tax=Temnothorax longispinosus TaxID=300112 RepID=A0A4S2KKF9_9HYME|nr:Uncharacterized protein DBV15_00796 [Temnothorax longispinosus]
MRASGIPNTSEVYLKMALANQNANIHIADLAIDEFFSKTELSSIAKNLSNELLLMAAKAYLLWNFPGVAMHPSAYCNLSSINKSRWNSFHCRERLKIDDINLGNRALHFNYVRRHHASIWQEYPMLHTPWLLMQLCVIIVEIVIFFVRFFLDGLHLKRNEILQAVFTLYNWLQVFCLFHQQTRRTI